MRRYNKDKKSYPQVLVSAKFFAGFYEKKADTKPGGFANTIIVSIHSSGNIRVKAPVKDNRESGNVIARYRAEI